MSGGLDEGSKSALASRLALQAFSQNAWPRQSSLLAAATDAYTASPDGEIDRAADMLTKITRNDGRLLRKQTQLTQQSRPQAQAQAVVVDRKRQPRSEGGKPKRN